MTMGPNLPNTQMNVSQMFYFNIKGSMNRKDVKLVAFLKTLMSPRHEIVEHTMNDPTNECIYFDNDNTQSWQSMEKHNRLKWQLQIPYSLIGVSAHLWVKCVFVMFFVLFFFFLCFVWASLYTF